MLWKAQFWQRIFLCSLVFALLAHTISYAIFNLVSYRVEAFQVMAELTSDIANTTAESSFEELDAYVKIFNKQQKKLWLERPDGIPIIGTPVAGFEAGRRDFPITRLEGRHSGVLWNKVWSRSSSDFMEATFPSDAEYAIVSIFETKLPDAEFISTMPVLLNGQQILLFLVFDQYQPVPMARLFLHGLITVIIIGGLLALWAAKAISFPLHRLRNEVLRIAAGDLDKRVNDNCKGEIAELAAAVNKLAEDLSQKITNGQELIANISHTLRSPISRINLAAANMEKRMRDEFGDAPDLPERLGSRFRHLHLIQEETARLDSLIGSSLLSSKLDLQHGLTLFPVDFSALCLEVSQGYDTLMENRGFAFERAIQPGLWVQGDEPTLCIIVTNLLDNSLKYTEAGGRVRIAVAHDKDDVLLTVENSHIPMPDAWLTGIFTPFFRGNVAKSSEGTGLGLYLVEKIAMLHHGRAYAGNSRLGVCFTVSLKLERNIRTS